VWRKLIARKGKRKFVFKKMKKIVSPNFQTGTTVRKYICRD
jgi:hypothetical protein